MAVVNSLYVSSVIFSVRPESMRADVDLTNPNSAGVTFPSSPDTTTGLFDQNNIPIYSIIFTFPSPGVHSLGSIIVNQDTNVDKFAVQLFAPSSPNQPLNFASQITETDYTSTKQNLKASILSFPRQSSLPITAIRISVLSTNDSL